jgi:radical SAM protein with 4Fe4S-binding SPASM domain
MDPAAVEASDRGPKLASGLLHFEKGGKHLFFVPDIPNWLVVNANAAALLLSCDGARSAGEIVRSFGLTGRSSEDALALFKEAGVRGVIEGGQAAKRIGGECPARVVPRATLAPLRSVYVKLTGECNLRCEYCYANSGVSTPVLAMEVLRRLSMEAAGMSPQVEFVLSGGEPLLHPGALDFAEEAVAQGHDVHLLTNGTLIDTDEVARRIAASVKLVKISLDGSTDEVHSMSRGRGNYARVTRAVDLLVHHGANVQVAMTVTRRNATDISNMASRYGSRLALQPLFKAGRGAGQDAEALTGEEYFLALSSVDGVAPMGSLARTLEGLRGRGVRKCALADREISVAENGDVYPCQLLHAPEFLAGNIHSSSLGDIYFGSPVLKKLRELDVDVIEECAVCPIRLICAGGCRARDYYDLGTVERAGEFCEYEKLAFINGILDHTQLE